MAKPLITNNAYSTLASSILNSDLSMSVATGEGVRFPNISGSDYFYVTLIDTSNNMEIVKVTAKSTDTFTIVRAQDGTTARAFSASDRVELRPTAATAIEVAAGGYLDSASIPADTITTTHITDSNVTLAKIQDIADNRFLGNDTGGAAAPEEITPTEATAMLDVMVGDSGSGGTKGLVPAPSANDADAGKLKVLGAGATWYRPAWHFIEELTGTGTTLTTSASLAGYELIKITVAVNPSTDDDFRLRMGSAGPTWFTGTTAERFEWFRHNSSSNTTGGGGDNAVGGDFVDFSEASYKIDSSANSGWVGEILIRGVAYTRPKLIHADFVYGGVTNELIACGSFSGYIGTAIAATVIEFSFTSGASFDSTSGILIEGRKFG